MTAIWTVYLSGEIHSDWRERIESGVKAAGLPIELVSPVTVHEDSDDCGVAIFGAESDKFWHDRKGAQLNAIRTQTLLKSADIAIVQFGEKYKQWNAAFEAGYAVAIGTPIITLHDGGLNHALKDIDAAAQAVAETPEQVVQILAYVTQD